MTVTRVLLPSDAVFPNSYGEDVLYGMALSPDQIYLYWELTEWRIRLYQTHGLQRNIDSLILRGYEQTQAEHGPVCTFSTGITERVGERFIRDLSRKGAYFFQIGVDHDGFVPLLTSNVIDLPGATTSNLSTSMPEQAEWWQVFLTYTVYEPSPWIGGAI
ncbi:DUF4912 domain-containing protein [Alicyclobacillus acidiphilus]|uniref:DUF4912 domain-containing protein n=1 Tax=Alicyclobacillus acidiphilus TaxID=182455 RepID=UPI00082B25C6|nr:DUF4912 domain-containing protein [Alicyclobacillus acidiphilus]